jgi:hypothetical protein
MRVNEDLPHTHLFNYFIQMIENSNNKTYPFFWVINTHHIYIDLLEHYKARSKLMPEKIVFQFYESNVIFHHTCVAAVIETTNDGTLEQHKFIIRPCD